MLNKSRNEVAKTIGIEVRAPIHYHVITTHYKQWCLCSMQRATSDTCAIISLQSNLQPNRMMNKIVESSPHFRHLHKYLIDLILVVFHLLHHGFVDPDNMHPLQDIVAKNDTQLPCGRCQAQNYSAVVQLGRILNFQPLNFFGQWKVLKGGGYFQKNFNTEISHQQISMS